MSLDREVEGDHDSRGRVTGRPPDGEQKILYGQVGDNPDPPWERAPSLTNFLVDRSMVSRNLWNEIDCFGSINLCRDTTELGRVGLSKDFGNSIIRHKVKI